MDSVVRRAGRQSTPPVADQHLLEREIEVCDFSCSNVLHIFIGVHHANNPSISGEKCRHQRRLLGLSSKGSAVAVEILVLAGFRECACSTQSWNAGREVIAQSFLRQSTLN